MRLLPLAVLGAVLWVSLAAGQPPTPPRAKTKVVLLGVEHSGQLAAKTYRPAMFEAFFDRVQPDAVCVERDPEAFAANDQYEFTYEITEIAVPYATREGLALCPFDWMPSKSDLLLAFGSDINAPPLVRPKDAFLTFQEPNAVTRTLFWAEDRKTVARWDEFADKPQTNSGAETARRLFLYRTVLQARRIAAAAHARPGQTLLVLVGAFHERDIETFLGKDSAIELVQAPTFGAPTEDEAKRHDSSRYRLAALTFNLLGQQANSSIDWTWMGEMLNALERETGLSPETRLLRLRFERLTGSKNAVAALKGYRALLPQVSADEAFTWTGVKDSSRLDSYFDPFGNLSVRQRRDRTRALCAKAHSGSRTCPGRA
jgi:hypothetical protein